MKHRAIPALLLLLFLTTVAAASTHPSGLPHSTDNDDSCDIALLPAATLLVPWFEVDLASPTGETTLVTVTNVSNQEQVARVTMWTDRAYPVMTFNVYLTGYDVQSLNLYDIIARGQIAPPNGTGFDDAGSAEGQLSDPNPNVDHETCRNLPTTLNPVYVTLMQQAFTAGTTPAFGAHAACTKIGGTHTHASGYLTIDVVRNCTATQPQEAAYFNDEILFDNVLVGEYQQINLGENLAQGSPAVHIRAIPEGGTAAQRAAFPQNYVVNAPQTFYGRFMPAGAPKFDSRQPLPSVYAVHWIAGGAGSFQTDLEIWRDAKTGTAAECPAYAANGTITATELVRFDEEENFTVIPDSTWYDPPIELDSVFAAAGRYTLDEEDINFPAVDNGAVAGWMYLNLDERTTPGARQAWVVASQRAQGRFSVDSDAVALGNGCSPAVGESEATVTEGDAPSIGPAANINP